MLTKAGHFAWPAFIISIIFIFMKKALSYLVICMFTLCACSESPIEKEPDSPTGPTDETSAYPKAWHDKIRQLPYPKASNEVHLNPVPFLVPQAMKHGELLDFELSQDSTFQTDVIRKKQVKSCMFNLHRRLESGHWYWRFRSYNPGQQGTWSNRYDFEMNSQVPEFVTPEATVYLQNLPHKHPRLYCFLDQELEEARAQVTRHPEYKQMLSRAKSALKADYASIDLFMEGENIKKYTNYLYTAYHLTQEQIYLDKMHEILTRLLNNPVSDSQLFADNFRATDYIGCFADCYDMLYPHLTAAERKATEDVLAAFVRYYYPRNVGYEENHIFDNHFWQRNMRGYVQAALLLYDKQDMAEEMLEMLDYYYELWTSRAPDTGFNLSGIWRNGTYYFNANVKTLWYMPMLYGSLTGGNFLTHPWYRNAGRGLIYSWPPQSQSLGFGDGREREDKQGRQRIAFADFLARELGDNYAGWYADQCRDILEQDYENRIYRMIRTSSYSTALPANLPKLVWYKEAGEVDIHSNLKNTTDNMALAFRSSPFASGSHTLADQNGFRLLYKGKDLFISSGYYQNFADAHNLLSYRHSRAHNTILVNGIGQPFDMKGYGTITRALSGEHISYCLGDASHAYCGISEDPMWIDNFKKARVMQTTNNGFGNTPLTCYLRHVLVLHPNIVILYDELEANNDATWQWLLHTHEAMNIDESSTTITANRPALNICATARLFSNQPFTLTQTDRFFQNPTNANPNKYSNQWHLTADFEACKRNRILAIIQVGDSPTHALPIQQDGNTFTIGNWTLEAELNPERPAFIHLSNSENKATLTYEEGKPTSLNDGNSTLSMDNEWPQSTRATK